jgi:hypothetical protein
VVFITPLVRTASRYTLKVFFQRPAAEKPSNPNELKVQNVAALEIQVYD